MGKITIFSILGFIGYCFKGSLKELNEWLLDYIKYMRFNNQLSFRNKAKNSLVKHGLNPNFISIKALSPLIKIIPIKNQKSKSLNYNWIKIDNYKFLNKAFIFDSSASKQREYFTTNFDSLFKDELIKILFDYDK